jgi:hypothetical protein
MRWPDGPPVAWFIGPDVAAAWPQVSPDLPLEGVLTSVGRDNADRIAGECIEQAAIEGLARRDLFGQRFQGEPAPSSCSASLPVAPATAP